MNTRLFSNTFTYALFAISFVVLAYLNNTYLRSFKLDLTEDNIYSLSDASKAIISDIDEPIHLKLFFSESTSKGYIQLRDYAKRVQSLLTEYSLNSKGKITLDIINPEPFSEQEDEAASLGLTSPTVGVAQDSLYFGLAGTNSQQDTFIIGFFDPQKEPFLEYDISSLLYKLSNPELPKLTIVSDLALAGGQNPLTGQYLPANVVYQQLMEFFDVKMISNSEQELPETDVLLLWHPQQLSQQLLYDIDQYIMQSRPAIVLYDPHYESDPMAQMGAVGANSSELPLLASYGIDTSDNFVVLDPLTGIEVQTSDSDIVRHLAYLGLTKEQINNEDLTTTDLEAINGASFGALSLTSASTLNYSSLLSSSDSSTLIEPQKYSAINDINTLGFALNTEGKQHTLAARFSGPASSHFVSKASFDTNSDDAQELPNVELELTDLIEKTDNINLLVIADADLAADRFWVQQSNFFGQTILSPFANNADLITNIIDNMAGSEQMIGIRGHGTFARPFERVQAIRMKAEEKFRAQEQKLQEQLQQTEIQLQELQTQSDSLALSDEQQKAIDNFTKQKIEIRKSLRDVQFQLEKEINQLGNYLKVVNIVYAPIGLVILLIVIARHARQQY